MKPKTTPKTMTLYRAVRPDGLVVTRESAQPLRFLLVAQPAPPDPEHLDSQVKWKCADDVTTYQNAERRANANPGDIVEIEDTFEKDGSREVMNSASIRIARAWLAEAGTITEHCERQYAIHDAERVRILAAPADTQWYEVAWCAATPAAEVNIRRRLANLHNGQLIEVTEA